MRRQEQTLREKVQSFFPPDIFLHLPDDILQLCISSEYIFHFIEEGYPLDGMSAIFGYQKIADFFLKEYILKEFKSYVGNTRLHPQQEDYEEHALEQVIEKNYSLSFGRLTEILKEIQAGEKISGYHFLFSDFLDAHQDIKNSLLNSDFLVQCEKLNEMEIFGEKRHMGFLSKEDTKIARNYFTGNFESYNCIFSKIALFSIIP